MTRADAAVLDKATTDAVPVPRPVGRIRELPWPDPGQFPRRTRPRSEYWDVENARWVSRPPVPGPRRGR